MPQCIDGIEGARTPLNRRARKSQYSESNTRSQKTSVVSERYAIERSFCLKSRRMDQRVQRVKAMVDNNFDRELPVGELARFVNLSVSHLQHLFKRDMGQSPARYIQALRLERARELLENSSLSIKQILIRIGVKDRSNFERRFKQTHKVTPAQYRRTAGLRPPRLDLKSPKTDCSSLVK